MNITPMKVHMTRNPVLAIIALLLALSMGWLAGRHLSLPAGHPSLASDAPAATQKVLYYRNPMGLPDTSPVPKKDAMGMDYLPVYEGGEPPATSATVVLSPEKIQSLGVRTLRVQRQPLALSVRASATVQIDQTRRSAIAPRFEGWVVTLHANQTGMALRRGQPLLTVYSPQLRSAQEEYQLALRSARTLAKSDPVTADTMRQLADAARIRLRNWNIDDALLTDDSRAGDLVLRAPGNAVLIASNIVEGARFMAGETILELADLSSVWVVADVPAANAHALSLGQNARFESPALPGLSFSGKVTFIAPVIATATRTLPVRIELANPDALLRPGLYGDVQLDQAASRSALTVPRTAVLDSGTRQLVLVALPEGRFEPRTVRIGAHSGDQIEVLEGVKEGESVVVSANFLIDAESRLQSALDGMEAQ